MQGLDGLHGHANALSEASPNHMNSCMNRGLDFILVVNTWMLVARTPACILHR